MKRNSDILIGPERKRMFFRENSPAKHAASLWPNATEDEFIHFLDQCPVDFSGKQFSCIHNHCSDLNSCFRQEILNEYLSYHSLLYHPVDRDIWCKQVYPDIRRFSENVPKELLPNYRVAFNHRYINKLGKTSQFKHEGNLFFDDFKQDIILKLGVFIEIDELKTDDSMVLTIYRYSTKLGYEKVFGRVYSDNQSTPLSRRELEIIRLCSEGLSSKMIADRLCLSIHTVKNHKRNIMEKTMTHNITELIHVCSRNRWL